MAERVVRNAFAATVANERQVPLLASASCVLGRRDLGVSGAGVRTGGRGFRCSGRGAPASRSVALTGKPTCGRHEEQMRSARSTGVVVRAPRTPRTRPSMSPRKLSAETTFADLETEVLFTIAGLGADPDCVR